jgi:hypothetical protein
MSDNGNDVRTNMLDFCLSDICHDETIAETEKLFKLFLLGKMNFIFQTDFSEVANLKHQKVNHKELLKVSSIDCLITKMNGFIC